MAKINDIIKSKLADKSDMPDWYQERLEVCSTCPLNSKNFKPNPSQKARFSMLEIANMGKPWCWSCGCEITAKAYLPEEECPESKWDKERKYESLGSESLEYTVTNLSPEKVKMSYNGAEFTLDYGRLRYLNNTDVKLLIDPKEEGFTDLSTTAGCGCTTPSYIRRGKSIELVIKYDSTRIGEFNKLVTLSYKSDKRRQILIRIKGVVKK